MRKRAILAFMLIIAMCVAGGCKLIVKDAEVDKSTVIVEVLGEVLTKGEIAEEESAMYSLYSMYGYPIESMSVDMLSNIRAGVIDGMVRNIVMTKRAAADELDQFTAEELAAMEESVSTTFDGYAESIKTTYFAETELTGAELDAAVMEQMTALGYPTLESMLESEKTLKAQEKLRDEVVKDVQVSEEELSERYNTNVEAAKAALESDPASFSSTASSGGVIYAVPAGFRYVKHILRQFSEEDQAAITEAQGTLSAAQARVTSAETLLTTLNEDPAQDTEEEVTDRAQWEQDKSTAAADVTTAQATLDTVKEVAYVNLQPKIDEILLKLSEDADFDALLEEYGEDDGMRTSPTKEEGYLVGPEDTQWVVEFRDAAMALQSIGDLSPAVKSDFGIHILKYVSDKPEGVVPLEDVRVALTQELLTEKQTELFDSTVNQWIDESGIKFFPDRMM